MQESGRKAIIVKSKTKLELLNERFNTMDQARFMIDQQRENLKAKKGFLSEEIQASISINREKKKMEVGSGEFSDFEAEHHAFYKVLENVQKKAANLLKIKTIDNTMLPSFLFSEDDVVIVIGQDGLVANTAKYVNNIPIIAVNPDTSRFDGILLPFNLSNFEVALSLVLKNQYKSKLITMAEAKLNDGQRLLAFNDLFIGPGSHTSARYLITHNGLTETHSSSGMIVSTGAGCTGWLSSLFNMANGIHRIFGNNPNAISRQNMAWDTDSLIFIVREPFLSKTSQINLSAGFIQKNKELVVESLMPKNGLIFSDGVEADNIKFTSGLIARIGIAPEKAKLVLP